MSVPTGQKLLIRLQRSILLTQRIFLPPRHLWGKRLFYLLRWIALGTWGWLESYYFDRRYMEGVHFRRGDLSEASNIWVIRHMLAARPLQPRDVFVDVGCGAGRVLRWLVHQGYKNRLIGVELDASMAAMARRFLAPFPNVEVIHANILQAIPPDATVFYLYNLLDEPTLQLFKEALFEKFKARGNVTLIYTNASLGRLFFRDPRWEVEIVNDPVRDNELFSPLWNPDIPPLLIIRLKASSWS